MHHKSCRIYNMYVCMWVRTTCQSHSNKEIVLQKHSPVSTHLDLLYGLGMRISEANGRNQGRQHLQSKIKIRKSRVGPIEVQTSLLGSEQYLVGLDIGSVLQTLSLSLMTKLHIIKHCFHQDSHVSTPSTCRELIKQINISYKCKKTMTWLISTFWQYHDTRVDAFLGTTT